MRLIDADALIEFWKADFTEEERSKLRIPLNVAIENLRDSPTVDAVVRKRGRWIDEPVYKQTMDGRTWDGYTYCSECREMHEYGYRSNFCPNCGADMRKGEE